MPIDKSKIHKILIISLSNMGDVILTFPVFDVLRADFPSAEISMVVGPRAQSLVQNHPLIKDVIVFNKHQPLGQTLSWINNLRQQRFDMVVDLRNTAIPLFISARYRTTFFVKKSETMHMRDKHLLCLRSVYAFDQNKIFDPKALYISDEDRQAVHRLLDAHRLADKSLIVFAAGAADRRKRWPETQFALLADALKTRYGFEVVFVGDGERDLKTTTTVLGHMKSPGINLCGQTTMIQTAEIIRRGILFVGNDSSSAHLASYQNVPMMVMFGPTNALQYGPWNNQAVYVKYMENNDIAAILNRIKITGTKVAFAAA